MSTAMSTKRVFVATKPQPLAGQAKWLLTFAAGCGAAALGVGAENAIITGIGAALLGAGLLYANAQLWLRYFGSRR